MLLTRAIFTDAVAVANAGKHFPRALYFRRKINIARFSFPERDGNRNTLVKRGLINCAYTTRAEFNRDAIAEKLNGSKIEAPC